MKTATEDPVLLHFLRAIEPFAASCREIRLFGSRARDDFRPDSDYDILITLDQKDSAIKSKLYDAVMDVLLATGKLISLKIYLEKSSRKLTVAERLLQSGDASSRLIMRIVPGRPTVKTRSFKSSWTAPWRTYSPLWLRCAVLCL